MNTQKTTMKSLPASERPYEKCEAYGPAALSDAELLAVILRSGTRSVTSLELAQKLLLQFGARRGLGFLREVTRAELLAVPGIGSVKATELLAAGELSRRIARAEKRGEISLGRPKAIASYFMEDRCYLDHEEMWVAMFNTKNKLIHTETVSMGTVNASLASPREIFLNALRHHAVFVVLLHNHPSGDPEPSAADIELTNRLASAGALLHIPVMDHIIIGDHCYLSFRERGLLDQPEMR